MDVFLADAHPQVRSALRLLLEQEEDLVLAGEAADTDELLAAVRASCPAVVLIDWELPGLRGRKTLELLRERCPEIRVIALGGSPEVRPAALASGADAFVSKGEPPERIPFTLRFVLAGVNPSSGEGHQSGIEEKSR